MRLNPKVVTPHRTQAREDGRREREEERRKREEREKRRRE
jgi:hypothetical protein